jgi:hypothetical protein
VDAALSPLLTSDGRMVFVGVDAATKSDCSAAVGVTWDLDGRLRLVFHRIWRPSPGAPLDLGTTVEPFLRDRADRFDAHIVADPFQMLRSISALTASNIDIREFPQTTGNVTRMGEALFEVLQSRRLRLYPAPELREQALNTAAVESAHGWKIAKASASRKVDAIVALAMAVVAALEAGPDSVAPLTLVGSPTWREWEAARTGSQEATRQEREALLHVVEPWCVALERGDETDVTRAWTEIEAHVAGVVRADAIAGQRVQALLDNVRTAIEGHLHADA